MWGMLYTQRQKALMTAHGAAFQFTQHWYCVRCGVRWAAFPKDNVCWFCHQPDAIITTAEEVRRGVVRREQLGIRLGLGDDDRNHNEERG